MRRTAPATVRLACSATSRPRKRGRRGGEGQTRCCGHQRSKRMTPGTGNARGTQRRIVRTAKAGSIGVSQHVCFGYSGPSTVALCNGEEPLQTVCQYRVFGRQKRRTAIEGDALLAALLAKSVVGVIMPRKDDAACRRACSSAWIIQLQLQHMHVLAPMRPCCVLPLHRGGRASVEESRRDQVGTATARQY